MAHIEVRNPRRPRQPDTLLQHNGKPWWLEAKDNAHNGVFSLVEALDQHQAYRQKRNEAHAILYCGDNRIAGLGAYSYYRVDRQRAPQPISLNVVQNMCDAATAKIAKNRPRPFFLTSGASDAQKRRAKGMGKYVMGQFHAMGVYKLGPELFHDGTIFGTGNLHVYYNRRDKRFCAERVLVNELIVDDAEAIDGKPPRLYRRRWVDRERLASEYPAKYRDKIMKAGSREKQGMRANTFADLVCVIEGWNLPTCRPEYKDNKLVNAQGGRHVLVIDNCTLVDEPYTLMRFPILGTRWGEQIVGFWGSGLAERLAGLQLELNKAVKTIQLSLHAAGVPYWLVESTSKIVKSHISNAIGGIISYTGTMPEQRVGRAVPPELVQWVQDIYAKAYEISGISQLSASSKKPPGLNSGVALDNYNDIESERFAIVGQNWEHFHMELAEHIIDVTREEARRGEDMRVLAGGVHDLEEINWKDVDLDESKYVLKVFPTNLLPETPAGKLSTVEKLAQVFPELKPHLLGLLTEMPDLEAAVKLITAPIEDAERQVEQMIEHGRPQVPEPLMDLQTTFKVVRSAYLRAKAEGVPEARVELLRRYLLRTQKLIDKAGPGAPAGAPPPGSPPTGPGGALPPPPGAPPPQPMPMVA